MAENGFGLEQPIFGDATIVSRNFLKRFAPGEESADFLSGGGLKAILEASGASAAGPAPIDHLVEIPPPAFVAVRRQDPDDALRYAESIRALLSATFVLTAGNAKGFALTPLPLQWSAAPSRVRLDAGGKLAMDRRVVASYFIHLTPIPVTHKALRASWEMGTPVHGSWTVHKEHSLSKALVGDFRSLSGLRRRIRDAASTLARAMEATDPSLSTLFGTVALESLLRDGASKFQEIEEMAGSIFTSVNGPGEISRLFGNRHRVAHEAMTPTSEAEHSQEIAAAWGVILMAAMASEHISTVDDFLKHLRGRVLAKRVADQLRERGRDALADELERAATDVSKRTEPKNDP